MKVLLLGATGQVGARLIPALLAHKHQVVAFVRTPAKLPSEARSNLDAIIVGSASDSAAIKTAILSHNCDAVINAAGSPALTSWTSQGEFPAIFAAVVQATVEAGRERGAAPIRCWLMSGFALMDSPKKPYLLLDYLPLFPYHRPNYELVRSHTNDVLAWSLFCATQMHPRHDPPQYPAIAETSASNLVAKADMPPAWSEKYRSVPLIGNYLNIMTQAQSYFSVLEDCVDFMAADLEKGLESEWIGKRVAVKEKGKVQ